MFTGEELMERIEHFGRRNVQELVAKRQDMWSVISYLRAEKNIQLAKGMVFVTDDLASFEKRASSVLTAQRSELRMEQR